MSKLVDLSMEVGAQDALTLLRMATACYAAGTLDDDMRGLTVRLFREFRPLATWALVETDMPEDGHPTWGHGVFVLAGILGLPVGEWLVEDRAAKASEAMQEAKDEGS